MTEATKDMSRLRTPEQWRLPLDLAEQIHRVVRLVGLPLALENNGVGVYLQSEDACIAPGMGGGGDCIEICWLVPDALLNATDAVVTHDAELRELAEEISEVTFDPLEKAVCTILEAAGLVVARNPKTNAMAVWADTGAPLHKFG